MCATHVHHWCLCVPRSRLDNRVKFILAMISGELDIRNKPKATIIAHLASSGYTAFPKKKKDSSNNGDDNEEEEEDSGASTGRDGYDYLLSMPFWSLTLEKVRRRGDCTTLFCAGYRDFFGTCETIFISWSTLLLFDVAS